LPKKKPSAPRQLKPPEGQHTYYVGAEYIDYGDRLLVEDGDSIELYAIDFSC
jgi:hypothetical protein